MASFPWQRNDVTQALRDRLLAPRAVTDGLYGVDVLPALPGEPVEEPAAAGSLVVLFRWKLDPAVYAVHFHLEPAEDGEVTDPPPGVSTGVPVASLQGWVSEVVLWLMEELDTGLVRRSARTQVGDVVLLGAGVNAVDVLPEGYYVGDVHLGSGRSNGDHLKRDGLTPRSHAACSSKTAFWSGSTPTRTTPAASRSSATQSCRAQRPPARPRCCPGKPAWRCSRSSPAPRPPSMPPLPSTLFAVQSRWAPRRSLPT